MGQPHSGNTSESSGTLCIVKKNWHMILHTESKIHTNNVIIQFSDIKYSGENTQKIEFILLTPFILKMANKVIPHRLPCSSDGK